MQYALEFHWKGQHSGGLVVNIAASEEKKEIPSLTPGCCFLCAVCMLSLCGSAAGTKNIHISLTAHPELNLNNLINLY